MKIVSIEPTPSPNNMKLNMNQSLPEGEKRTYTKENAPGAPDYIRRLLHIEGVNSVFQAADFIAVERHPKADWRDVLAEVRRVFADGDDTDPIGNDPKAAADGFGEIKVFVQKFKGIPIQIKLTTDTEEKRIALPERFGQAVMRAQVEGSNLVLERKWEEQGVRYGELEEVGEQIAEEIAAAYGKRRLERLVSRALEPEKAEPREELSLEEAARRLDHPDWKVRYAALDQIEPTPESLDVLAKAMDDPKMSVRRLAVAYIGMIEDPIILPYLFKALKDKSATVRRTAGDCLSDLGDPAAIDPMTEMLKDPNKIVRWRAARFLYEVGDESAIPALRQAQDDPEFEVQMQVKLALERIESGHEAEGTIWQQMTRAISKE